MKRLGRTASLVMLMAIADERDEDAIMVDMYNNCVGWAEQGDEDNSDFSYECGAEVELAILGRRMQNTLCRKGNRFDSASSE